MNQRGQVTLFIIVAVVIIGISLIVFLLAKGSILNSNPDVARVSTFVQDCVKQTGTNAVYAIGLQGGYYDAPASSISYGIPYYFTDGKNIMPSKFQIQGEISKFINNNLKSCINNFSAMNDLTINSGQILARSTINDGNVVVNVNYPLTIKKGDSLSSLSSFDSQISVRFGTIYNSVAQIVDERTNHEGICLSCMLDTSIKNDLYFDTIDYDNETTIISATDQNSKINNESFELVFAMK